MIRVVHVFLPSGESRGVRGPISFWGETCQLPACQSARRFRHDAARLMQSTVLIVDDESDVVDLIRYKLRGAGFAVH